MSAAVSPQFVPTPDYTAILNSTRRAAELTRTAATYLADVIAFHNEAAYDAVKKSEKELDSIDREVDASMSTAISQTSLEQSRQLLACMKFVIDLERIGDLIASVAGCAFALGPRVPMDPMWRTL